MYQTKITSQGTISLPAALRRKYDLQVGEVVTIEDDGKITVSKNTNFAGLRQKNASYLSNQPPHKNGAGFEAHVTEIYGQKK